MKYSIRKTVSLGDEFDTFLWGQLLKILLSLGATTSELEHFMGGAQEVDSYTVTIDGEKVHIEAATYMGLTITGPLLIVSEIQKLLGRSNEQAD